MRLLRHWTVAMAAEPSSSPMSPVLTSAVTTREGPPMEEAPGATAEGEEIADQRAYADRCLTWDAPAVSPKRAMNAGPDYSVVRIIGPSFVIATVCSK